MMNRIGAHIQAKRALRGWSLRDLARESKVSAATLSRIERGHDFSFSQLLKIAAAFDTPAGILLVNAGYDEPERVTRALLESARRLAGRIDTP